MRFYSLLFLCFSSINLFGQDFRIGIPFGHTEYIRNIEFSPNSHFFITASDDKTSILYNTNTGRALRTLHEHNATVNKAIFSPNNKLVATCSNDFTAIVFNAYTGQPLWTSYNKKEVRNIEFIPIVY